MTCRCGLPSYGFPLCYSHLKDRRLAGGQLTDEETLFAWSAPSPPNGDGWEPVDGWVAGLDPDPDVDLERISMLRVLVELGDMREEPSV